MGFTDPTAAGWSWRDLKYIRELWKALRERQIALGQAETSDPTTENKCRSVDKVLIHQQWLESNCTSFIRSHKVIGGTVTTRSFDEFDGMDADTSLTYTLDEWREVSGLNAGGFTRITSLHPKTTDHGLVQVGDYIDPDDPVYWREIIAGYKTLIWIAAPAEWCDILAHEGNCFYNATWAGAKAAAEADWSAGGEASETFGPHALASGTCWGGNDYHSHLDRRSARIGANVSRKLACQVQAYAKVKRMEGSMNPIFDGNGLYNGYENKIKNLGGAVNLPATEGGDPEYYSTARESDETVKPNWCLQPTPAGDFWQGYSLDTPTMIVAPAFTHV